MENNELTKIEEFCKKIKNTSPEKIDELWFKCGWMDSEKGKNKSLPDWRLKKIKENSEFCKNSIKNLLLETPLREFEKELENY